MPFLPRQPFWLQLPEPLKILFVEAAVDIVSTQFITQDMTKVEKVYRPQFIRLHRLENLADFGVFNEEVTQISFVGQLKSHYYKLFVGNIFSVQNNWLKYLVVKNPDLFF